MTGADFSNAKIHQDPEPSLDPAVFTGAANFSDTTSRGFTQAQLKSTASYKDKILDGIRLGGNNLSGWDFQGQSVKNAIFTHSNLAGADFANSIVSGSNFSQVILAGADFTNAVIQKLPADIGSPGYDGADFSSTTAQGFTQGQLQSTQSYQDKNLTGIKLVSNNLSGWDFHGQDLTSAAFDTSNLTGANLSQATLTSTLLQALTCRGRRSPMPMSAARISAIPPASRRRNFNPRQTIKTRTFPGCNSKEII